MHPRSLSTLTAVIHLLIALKKIFRPLRGAQTNQNQKPKQGRLTPASNTKGQNSKVKTQKNRAPRNTSLQHLQGNVMAEGASGGVDRAGAILGEAGGGGAGAVAQNTRGTGGSAIDARTSRPAGYEISQIKRQIAERVHALPETWSTMRRAMVRGLDRMNAHYQLALAGGNLVRLVNLTG